MKKNHLISGFAGVAGTILLTASLAGCSILYPNWGTTAKPADSASPSASTSVAPSVTPTASPSPTLAQAKAQISLLDSGVDVAGGNVYAVGEVTNVVEDGGVCTLTFIGAGKTKTVSGTAEANATDTQCHPLQIALAGLPKGAGLITISYESPTHKGTSAAVAVTIP